MSNKEGSFLSKHAGPIPLLDHLNYNKWQAGIVIHLKAIKVYGIVMGSVATPVSTVDNAGSALEFDSLEAKAIGAIHASCSESAKRYLTGCKSAKAMWDVLKERLNSATSVNGRLALRKQFRDCRPASGKPLSEFISKLHDLQQQLVGSEQAIDEETFKDQLLTSLPSAYNTLIEIILERESSYTMEDVIRKVLHAEMAKARIDGAISTNSSLVSGDALLSGTNSYRSMRGTYRGGYRGFSRRPAPYKTPFPGRCHSCSEIGHKAQQCTKKPSYFDRSQDSLAGLSCFACGEAGHGTRLCPHTNLSQIQAAKGRNAYSKWIKLGEGRSATAATSQVEEPGGDGSTPATLQNHF